MASLEVIDEILEKATAAPPPPREAEEEKDPSRIPQRQPPSRGLCRRCGRNKPVNRLLLCYPCWVKDALEKSGWREGMPHPDWCRCEGAAGPHRGLSAGN